MIADAQSTAEKKQTKLLFLGEIGLLVFYYEIFFQLH